MKKLFIVFVLSFLTLGLFSQSLFKPVPKDYFQSDKYTLTAGISQTTWLWRFNATLVADELVWNKVTKQFDSAPLSGVGPGFGVRHYYNSPDGVAVSDWGVSFVALIGTDLNNISPASFKPAITISAFNFLNVGVDYGIKAKAFGILFAASVNF